MCKYLVSKGIDESKLILEDKSLTTVQNAMYSVPLAIKYDADTIILCTSLYHLADPFYKAMSSFENELKGTNITLITYSR